MTVVASNYARKDNDLYQTEPWATEALLRHLPLGHGWVVWEPVAGNHLMADVIRDTGAKVRTSDVTTYFLNLPQHREPAVNAIITNPPYRDAVRWAELSLERCAGFVALLLTAKFDFGKTRRHLFADCPRFMAKIALVDRIQWFPGVTTGTEDHAWYVWGPAPAVGAPYIPRMYWEGREPAA